MIGCAAVAAFAIAGITASVLIPAGPAPITAHGILEISTSIPVPGSTYSGAQVTVVSPAGVTVATGTLAPATASASVDLEITFASYRFTVTVPGGLSEYGIRAWPGGNVVWESAAQMAAGPSLCVGNECPP